MVLLLPAPAQLTVLPSQEPGATTFAATDLLLFCKFPGTINEKIYTMTYTAFTNQVMALASGLGSNTTLRTPLVFDPRQWYSNSVPMPYWSLSGATTNISGASSSRQLWKDAIGAQMLEVRHNDLGANNNVMYFGSLADWDAISLQINGSLGPVGGANPRITFVMGDDAITWRFRETNVNDAADNNLLGHNNDGNVIIGSSGHSLSVPGTLIISNGLLAGLAQTFVPTNSSQSNLTVNFAVPFTRIFFTNNLTLTNFSSLSSNLASEVDLHLVPQLINRGLGYPTLGGPGYAVYWHTNANSPLWTTLTNGLEYLLNLKARGTNIYAKIEEWR